MSERLHQPEHTPVIPQEKASFSEEEKAVASSQMKEILVKFETLAKEKDPEKWYRPMAKEFLKLAKRSGELHPLARNFVAEMSPAILEAFREELTQVLPHEQERIIDVFSAVRNFAEKLQPNIEQEKMPFEDVDFQQLAESGKISIEEKGGEKIIKIQVDGEFLEVPLPEEGVLYKGGVARIVAKVFTNSSIKGESTKPDIDLVIKRGDRPIEEILQKYKTGITDTEVVDEIDPGRILATRDVDMNAVLVSKDGLLITEAARKACETRVIHPLLPKERELFGRSTFKAGNIDLTRSVLLYRLVRMVVDNKADAFEIKKAEMQVPLGIYWLILAKHYIGKPEQQINIPRLFEIAKEMGQVGESQNPFEWLEQLHSEYPEFSFSRSGLSKQDYAHWLFGKFLKLVSAKYRHSIDFYQKDFEIKDPSTALQLVKIPEIQNPDLKIDDEQIEEFLASIQKPEKL